MQEVEQKTRKNLSTIENKSSLNTERPRQILDRLLSIDKDIEEMMRQAAIFGENGQIDDSSRCLEEVERLREHRKEVDLMGDNLLAVVKHQKVHPRQLRFAKCAEPSRPSTTLKKESRCTCRAKYIRASSDSELKSKLSKSDFKSCSPNSTRTRTKTNLLPSPQNPPDRVRSRKLRSSPKSKKKRRRRRTTGIRIASVRTVRARRRKNSISTGRSAGRERRRSASGLPSVRVETTTVTTVRSVVVVVTNTRNRRRRRRRRGTRTIDLGRGSADITIDVYLQSIGHYGSEHNDIYIMLFTTPRELPVAAVIAEIDQIADQIEKLGLSTLQDPEIGDYFAEVELQKDEIGNNLRVHSQIIRNIGLELKR